jgi:hypothetical protein
MMIFRYREMRNWEGAAVKVSMAMVFVTIGLMLIVVGVAWPTPSSPSAHSGLNPHDSLRGFLFSIAIVLEIVGVVIAASAARAVRKD